MSAYHRQLILDRGGEVIWIPREQGLRAFYRTVKQALNQYHEQADTVYLNIQKCTYTTLAILAAADKAGYRILVHDHAMRIRSAPGTFHHWIYGIVDRMCLHYIKDCSRLAVSEKAGRKRYRSLPFRVLCAGFDASEYAFSQDIRQEVRGQHQCRDKFVVGYGLDYAQKYRNLPYIGVLKKEIYST